MDRANVQSALGRIRQAAVKDKRERFTCLIRWMPCTLGILTKKVNWVLDGDISSFFDGLDHEWLVKFIERRIADQRVVRLIRKWMRAGVLEEGRWTCSEEVTPQGGSASPLSANIFLHYVFDLWVRYHLRQEPDALVALVRICGGGQR